MDNFSGKALVPFISIFDMTGRPLATSEGWQGISVVNLRYKYNDEDDDTCVIKLQMKEPKLIDQLGIQRGFKLQLKWGYLGDRIGPILSVVVRDVSSRYGSDMVYTDLECTDYLSYLKIVRSDDIGEGAFIDYIKAQIYGQYDIIIKDRDKIVYSQIRRAKLNEHDIRIGPFPGEKESSPRSWLGYTEELMIAMKNMIWGKDEDVYDTRSLEIGRWFVDPEHPVRKFLEQETGIPTSNRSTYVVIQDIFRRCPHGPWFVTGRGDTLLIHNRNLAGNTYRHYNYWGEPGDLINFAVKTKYDNFDKQVISYAGMDPANRTNFFIDDYRRELYKQRRPDQILEDVSLTDEQKAKELKAWLELRMIPYAKFGVVATEGAFYRAQYSGGAFFVPGYLDKAYVNKLAPHEQAAPDKTNVENPDPFIRKDVSERFDKWQHDPVLRATWYTIPLLPLEDAVNLTNNRQRELEMDKEEGTLILIGDPWLRSEINVSVGNISKIHEGNYYVKECEHTITQEGYKVTLNCFRIFPEAISTSFTGITQEEYDLADDELKELIDKQYKREQELFGPDLLLKFKEDQIITTHTGISGFSREVRFSEKVSLRELLYERGHSYDEAIEILMETAKKPGVEIQFSPENQ